MNLWMERSIDFANSRDYLDELFGVYPMSQNPVRDIDDDKWRVIENAYNMKDYETLISCLLQQELFPIKDSYVAFLRRDTGAIKRNPETVKRLCGRLHSMGLEHLHERCAAPKETNRQLGPLFKRWIKSNVLGVTPCKMSEFTATNDNAILG